MQVQYWNKEIETLDRDSLEKLQLKLLRETITQALKTPFYRARLKKAGLNSGADIESLADLRKIPYTSKEDLRQAYPYGMLGVSLDEVVRIHASSGTTGIPTVIYHTKEDIENWAELVARCIVMTGCGKEDVFQNMMSYGLFTGGLGLHYGAEKVGLVVIPAGGGNTQRQIQLMRDFKSTVLHITPSYLLHVADKIRSSGYKLEDFNLKKAFLGAEPYSESIKNKIEEILKIDVYNSYGLSEMNGPGVSFECVYKNGMHTWEDAYVMEIIDPETLDVLGEEEEGELVFTILRRKAMPLLRYRTRDLSLIYSGQCPCGRTHRRIARIKGRSDDMLIINGINVFPSQIEEVLMSSPEVGNNYEIRIQKDGYLDKLEIRVEITNRIFQGDVRKLERLRDKLKADLKASIVINPVIELVEPGSLPHSEGKAQRVYDERKVL